MSASYLSELQQTDDILWLMVAARAGEYGKGFAVVDGAVRELARQSRSTF